MLKKEYLVITSSETFQEQENKFKLEDSTCDSGGVAVNTKEKWFPKDTEGKIIQ